jgi:hypothetical protein
MFINYFYRDRKVFNPKIFFGILSKGNFENDVKGFIKSDTKLELTDIKTNVIEKYDFISFLDEKDNQFLNLSKVLLGKQVSKEMRKMVVGIEYPFKMLFDGVKNVNADIFKIKTEEIKIYKKPPRV